MIKQLNKLKVPLGKVKYLVEKDVKKSNNASNTLYIT